MTQGSAHNIHKKISKYNLIMGIFHFFRVFLFFFLIPQLLENLQLIQHSTHKNLKEQINKQKKELNILNNKIYSHDIRIFLFFQVDVNLVHNDDHNTKILYTREQMHTLRMPVTDWTDWIDWIQSQLKWFRSKHFGMVLYVLKTFEVVNHLFAFVGYIQRNYWKI